MKFTRLLLLGFLLSSASAQAQPSRSTLEICTDEAEAAEILQRLDGWMSTARISRRPLAACDDGSGAYLGRFVPTRTGTAFLLQNPEGGTLRQTLPWLGRVSAPLAEIDRLQRLPQFSILLESLLAEDRLGLAAPPPAEKPPPPPPKKKPPKKRARPKPPPAVKPEPEAPPEAKEEPEPEIPVEGPRSEEPAPFLDLRPEEEPEPEPPPLPPPPPPPLPGREDFGVPLPRRTWSWSGEAFGSLRFRSPDFFGPEAGLGASYGPFGFQLGLQIPTRWEIQGRPLGVIGLWASFQLRHTARFTGTEFGLAAGITVESMWVERLDLPWAEAHGYWDAGPSIGAELRQRLLGGTMGVGVEVGGMPTARTIRLPDGGTATLGGVWGRIALRFGIGG